MTSASGRPGHPWRRRLSRVAVALVLLYVGAIAYLMLNETRLIFRNGEPLGAARPSPPSTLAMYRAADGAMQPAWLAPDRSSPPGDTWVLYLHGNDSTISSRMNLAHVERLRGLGLNVFAPEYRGYAGTAGTPTEASVTADARAAWTYLRTAERVPASYIVIYGWSLGSAIAVTLASEVDEAAVILEGAPASVAAIGARQYPYIPIRLIIRNPFDSIDRIGRIGSPALFLHSPEDELIPISEGRRLFDAAQPPRTFVEVRGGHIRASEADADHFYGAVRDFLAAQHLLRRGPTGGGQPDGGLR
jgi:uncharacterized protein